MIEAVGWRSTKQLSLNREFSLTTFATSPESSDAKDYFMYENSLPYFSRYFIILTSKLLNLGFSLTLWRKVALGLSEPLCEKRDWNLKFVFADELALI